MVRTFVVGDIHGSLKALKQIVERAQLRQQDRLIFLGDYVDGWPQSAQVIDYLLELDLLYDCIFIKGNHDAWSEDWLRDDVINELWYLHGGKETIQSYDGIERKRKDVHLEFLERMKYYYLDEENRLFIHAGFTSIHGPERERFRITCFWDRTLWELALAVDERIDKSSARYPKRLSLFNEIYIGHTPTLKYDITVPMKGANVWNMDTGAAFFGRLSIMNIDSKEYFQSDIVQELYPNIKGRTM